MGVEAIEDYLPPQQLSEMDGVEEDITHLHEKDIMKLNHGWGLEERIKCVKPEGDPTMDANIFPTDTIDGLPTPKKIHNIYFVRFPSIEDLKLKNEINQLDKDMKDMIRDKVSITETIRLIKMNRAQVNSSLIGLNFYYKRCRKNFEKWSCSERNEVEPLYQALRKLRSARNKIQARGNDLCSSEEELNYLISSLRYRMQHRSNTLVTEKQLLGEIKQLEGTREKVISDAAMKEKIYYPWGQGKQLKITYTDVWLDEMRTERQYNGRIKALEKHVKAMDTDISTLEKNLRTNQKRIAEYKSLNELKKQQDKWNAYYSENCLLLNNARDLAAKKDVAALEELSRTEVENYMSLWSSNKAFRDDYVKRNLASPYNRKLRSGRDG